MIWPPEYLQPMETINPSVPSLVQHLYGDWVIVYSKISNKLEWKGWIPLPPTTMRLEPKWLTLEEFMRLKKGDTFRHKEDAPDTLRTVLTPWDGSSVRLKSERNSYLYSSFQENALELISKPEPAPEPPKYLTTEEIFALPVGSKVMTSAVKNVHTIRSFGTSPYGRLFFCGDGDTVFYGEECTWLLVERGPEPKAEPELAGMSIPEAVAIIAEQQAMRGEPIVFTEPGAKTVAAPPSLVEWIRNYGPHGDGAILVEIRDLLKQLVSK